MNPKKLLELAREQFAEAYDAETMPRMEAQEDISIYDGSGIWDQRLRSAREGDPKGARPCLVVSDLGPRVHQVTNDFRQNRPSIKVRPADDKADVDTANVFDGLMRHIEEQSNADIAYETANFYQSVAGFGYFRIVEEYCEGSRELFIRPVYNIFSVYMDPFAMSPTGADARYCFITEDIPRAVFEREHPGVNFESWEGGDGDSWITDDSVRVAEWMQIEEKSANRIKTEAGEVSEDEYWAQAEKTGEKPEVMGTYTTKRTVCMWRKLIGNKILKEVELPITFIPVIRMAGESYLMEGKRVFKGMIRDSRDAVRMVSYNFSSYIEAVALQPKAPFIGAVGQFDGVESQWAGANVDNAPYLEYNPVGVDGQPAPPPQRSQPPMASQGIIQGLVLAQNALKDTSGMGAASLGQKGNETSGKAILARQREGDVSTFHLHDNAAKAIRQCGRILIQWSPKTYDERKVARIIGEDGSADQAYLDPSQPEAMRKVPAMQPDGSQKIRKIYNIGVGRYDVIASVGPSYTTKRVEQAEMMNQLFQSFPQSFQVLGDIFMENQDSPGADRMAKRLKAMLPPQAAAADGDDQGPTSQQLQGQIQQMQQHLQEGASIVQELQQENAKLQQQIDSKQGETQAKIYATNEDTEREKIRSIAQIQIAEMNNESKETIAGLQHTVSQMQMQFQQQQAFIQSLMQLQQTEHSQGMDVAGMQQSQEQSQFDREQAMSAQQPETPPAGG